jgi:hypothetical protein
MDEITKIVIEDFEKKPDGSWVVIQNSDIITRGGNVIRLTPGIPFRKGRELWGFDVAKTLDEIKLK